jgi:hypothetical protein
MLSGLRLCLFGWLLNPQATCPYIRAYGDEATMKDETKEGTKRKRGRPESLSEILGSMIRSPDVLRCYETGTISS